MFSIGPVTIYGYGLMIGLGVLFCILMGMLFVQLKELRVNEQRAEKEMALTSLPGRNTRLLPLLIGALYLLFAVGILPSAIVSADKDVEAKEENNIRYNKLYAYLSDEQNQENFYFIDVYSSVYYTEKMFVNVDNSLDNYDIMGGWACKSPLWKKKLSAFGIDSMEDALVNREDVYYVQETGADTDWLYAYYWDHGMEIILQLQEEPLEEFEIYRVITNN